MSRPLLQLALDHTSLQAAQRDVALLSDHVDIVEAGTILCLTEGLNAVKALREQCPEKIIVADWKVADAGETESGITIHYVNGNYDEGNVIFQAKCPVLKSDTYEDVAKKVHTLEYTHFPVVISSVLDQTF